MMNSLLLWFLLLFAFYVMYSLGVRSGARRAAAMAPEAPPVIPTEKLAACEARLAPLMMITGHRHIGEERRSVPMLLGFHAFLQPKGCAPMARLSSYAVVLSRCARSEPGSSTRLDAEAGNCYG